MSAFSFQDSLASMLDMREAIARRKYVIALVLMSIVVRIPRVSGIIGNDAFLTFWMGRALVDGHWEIWTLSPVSVFGLHPYSPGAISVPLLSAIMIGLGLSYEAIAMIVSTVTGIIGTLGAYALGAELFRTKQGSFVFALFYAFSHIFIRFTYYTLTLRGPFLAVLPWFLLCCIKIMRIRDTDFWIMTRDGLSLASQRARRYLTLSVILYLILLLTHGLAVFLIIYAGVVIGYLILMKFRNFIRARWRIAKLEKTLDPKRLVIVEEKASPQRTKEEILASIEWLKPLPEQIPEMDDAVLLALKEELHTTHELYSRAFETDETTVLTEDVGATLRMALLEKIRMALLESIMYVIIHVDREIESRSSKGLAKPVLEHLRGGFSSDSSIHASERTKSKHSSRIRWLFGEKLELKMFLSGLVSWLVFLAFMGGAYFVGTRILPIQAAKTAPLLGLSNTSLLGLTVNLVVDYGIRLGLWSVFLPIGVLGAFHRDRESNRRIVHYLLLPVVIFTLPMSTYASWLFLPVFAYYSVVGFNVIQDSLRVRWIGVFSFVFALAFGFSYQLIVVLLPLWFPVLLASIAILSLVVMINRLRKWYSYQTLIGKTLRRWKRIVGEGPMATLDKLGIVIFVLSVILVSLATNDGLLLQDENAYLSDDEKIIIDFLDAQVAPGITIVPTPVIGRRLEAYGFPAVLSYNDAAALYFGWPDPNNVTFRLSPWNVITTGTLYVAEGRTPEKVIWNQVGGINLTNPAEYEYAKEVGLEFVIVEKNATGYSDIYHSVYGEIALPILHTAPMACELAVEGQKMSLFRLP